MGLDRNAWERIEAPTRSAAIAQGLTCIPAERFFVWIADDKPGNKWPDGSPFCAYKFELAVMKER